MKTSIIKFKLWQSLVILLTLVLAATVFLSLSPNHEVSADAQTGTVLANFLPEGTTGNGRGMAFDGTNLYYTVEGDFNIYKVTTTGAALATIPIAGEVAYGGPLAWDGSALWTMDYAEGSFILYRIDPADGSILSSCDIAAQNPGHPAVASSPRNIGEYPDGLDWTGSTLWISSEAFSNNWVVEVDTNCNILKAFNPPANLGQEGYFGGTSGIAFDGVNLWHPTHTNSYLDMLIFQTDTTGATTGQSFVADRLTEDLAYDPTTFAPLCALWGNEATFDANHLTAYEIPCPPTGPVVINVTIDIKPGSDPNCINNNGKGVIPVAILGSAGFNVSTIDQTTVKLESMTVKTAGKKNNLLASIKDVNGDGFADLVVQIQDQDGVLQNGNGTATLTGNLLDGTPIEGSDSICIVPSS